MPASKVAMKGKFIQNSCFYLVVCKGLDDIGYIQGKGFNTLMHIDISDYMPESVVIPLEPKMADLQDVSVRKVIAFLVENRGLDYSKEEIATGSDISRPTLYRIWPVLEKNSLLKETRKYGNAQLYKINENNEFIKVWIKLELALVREQIKRMKSYKKK